MATDHAPHSAAAPAGTDAADVLDPALRGIVRVLGGPGTGKTSLLVDIAAARIGAGHRPGIGAAADRFGPAGRRGPQRADRRAAGRRATQPCRRWCVNRWCVRVHSYAFAVLRLAAQRAGDPPPRLITGAEQDGVIRELLAGDLEDGARRLAWPQLLRPALATAGFATELRDLLARCTERGVDPLQLQRIGRPHGRPEWAAAGRFAQQYEQVMLLRAAVGMAAPQATVPALGAAELVGAALDAFGRRPRAAGRRARPDPAAAGRRRPAPRPAGRAAGPGAGRRCRARRLAGDPNQAVFGFRGADPALLLRRRRPAGRP